MTDRFDTGVAHPARRYNYWLGGKDNFAADRESGDLLARSYPAARIAARANRAFLRRAVRYVAAEAGVRQFLDIGTGLPTADNTHEVAQRVAPSSRVVYVDNDPMVLSHARALLSSAPEGRTHYLEADLRSPEKILADPAVREVLDFDRPVALMLIAVLHFVQDDAEAAEIVRTLTDALPTGSYLALSHATTDFTDAAGRARYLAMIDAGQVDAYPRSAADLAGIVDGLELLEPGFVAVSEWRPVDDGPRPAAADVAIYGALARKS